MMSAKINHRLNRKNVPCFYFRSLSWFAVIRYLRVLVHATANSMAHIIADHRITMSFRVLLHDSPNVSQMLSRTAFLNRAIETLLSDANQSHPVVAHSSYRNCSRRISNKPIQSHTTVNRKYVPFLQLII